MASQTMQEKAELTRIWLAHPVMVELSRAAHTHAQQNNLTFDPDGMTATLQFIQQWINLNGPLPDSGVLCD